MDDANLQISSDNSIDRIGAAEVDEWLAQRIREWRIKHRKRLLGLAIVLPVTTIALLYLQYFAALATYAGELTNSIGDIVYFSFGLGLGLVAVAIAGGIMLFSNAVTLPLSIAKHICYPGEIVASSDKQLLYDRQLSIVRRAALHWGALYILLPLILMQALFTVMLVLAAQVKEPWADTVSGYVSKYPGIAIVAILLLIVTEHVIHNVFVKPAKSIQPKSLVGYAVLVVLFGYAILGGFTAEIFKWWAYASSPNYFDPSTAGTFIVGFLPVAAAAYLLVSLRRKYSEVPDDYMGGGRSAAG